MTPRQKIFSLPSNTLLEEAFAKVIESHHSRIPVYDETRGPEHIVGVVYSRDLGRLLYLRTAGAQPGTPQVELRLVQIMREILVVPESKSVLDLIREFQQHRRHLAVAVDEYGSIVGLVTAEDAVEQLTGEFEDEFDAPSMPLLTTAGGPVVMDGGVNLRDLETQMHWDLPREGGVETLAGFMLVQFGHIPQVGESVVYDGRKMTVTAMDGRRIARIRVEPVISEAPEST